jgi:hypothetical protein
MKDVEVVEKKEVVKVEATPATVVELAIEKGAPIEQIAQLMQMKITWENYEAKKAYVRAMSEFKANPPHIEKDKTVAYGNTKYKHATLANVTEKINTELSKHGLSASWETHQNGAVSVTCKITHVLGHSEQTTLTAPADTSGSKNAIQAIGSTISYLQRYTLLALTGLATEDMDDDAQQVNEYLTEAQISQLCDIVDNMAAPREAATIRGNLLKFLGVESVDKIPAKDFDKAVSALSEKKKNMIANQAVKK